MACAPQLVQPAAGAACAANASFGCWSDSSVWVAPPCAAHFHCGPARTLVFCAAATRTAVCSCAKKKGRAVRLPHPRGMEELARLHLAPWTKRGIFSSDLSRTEAFLSPLNRYAAPGAWRAKLLGGSLWIKPIHARQQWIERTSVLRLLLLALPSPPHERLPDVDLLYVHSDFDISPPRGYNCTLRRPGRCEDTRLPLFINANMPERATLPFPDFSWVGWGVRTEPWCSLLPQMDAASRATPWVERIDLGYFSGGLRSGLFRNALREISTSPLAAGVLRVRDVAPSFYTLSKASQLGAEKPEPMSAACGYRYLLSVPGYGYSNRLKALLACGSVVIHVEPRSGPQEFYRPLLVNGKHLVVVRSVHQIIPAILELRRNSTRAERIGKLKRAECGVGGGTNARSIFCNSRRALCYTISTDTCAISTNTTNANAKANTTTNITNILTVPTSMSKGDAFRDRRDGVDGLRWRQRDEGGLEGCGKRGCGQMGEGRGGGDERNVGRGSGQRKSPCLC